MDELKPCPFCGGHAVISVDLDGTSDSAGRMWGYTIVCERCCATSGLTFSEERATDAWNRRAGDVK